MADLQGARLICDAIVISMAPDVCKTPVGSATPPVPYPITAPLNLSASVSPNVFFNNCPAFHEKSLTAYTLGAEAGTAMGEKSNTVGSIAEPIDKSTTVQINGCWAIRHNDLFSMNHKNTMGRLSYSLPTPSSSSSKVGLPSSLLPSSLSSSFGQGIMGKLTSMAKQAAMTAVMGGDPMAALKAMTDPRTLIKNQLQQYLGGLMQNAGPIGSMIGGQVLNDQVLTDIVNGRNPTESLKQSLSPENFIRSQVGNMLQNNGAMAAAIGGFAMDQIPRKDRGSEQGVYPQQQMKAFAESMGGYSAPQSQMHTPTQSRGGGGGGRSRPQPRPQSQQKRPNPQIAKNPMASPALTAALFAQADIKAPELRQLLSGGYKAEKIAPRLDRMDFASAYASTLGGTFAHTKDLPKTPEVRVLKENENTFMSIAKTHSRLATKPFLAPKTDWKGLLQAAKISKADTI